MRLVLLSNFITVHQIPLCNYMYKELGDAFHFIATEEFDANKVSQGHSDQNNAYPFIVRAYESENEKQRAQQLTNEADVVILGSAPMEFLQSRLRKGKLTFLYSERLYKAGYEVWKLPVRLWRFWKKYGRHKSLYLLCASAFTAADYAKTCTFLNKTYKWGYFPKTHHYEKIDTLLEQKEPASILWVARFIDWKHPEYVVEVAHRLKAENYDFHIQMLGSGEKWDAIAQMIQDYDLCDQVQLVGAVPAEEVRKYMDAASIFMFTSDRNEGWGAVLNESMNSGCAVIADSAIGAVPFLLENGENGLIYNTCNVDELYEKVKYLLDHPEICRNLGKKAYETVTGLWNAETAAERLLSLSQALMHGQKHPQLYESGPCSIAEILKD